MTLFNAVDPLSATIVGFGVQTLLVSSEPTHGPVSRRLSGMGCQIEVCDELYFAIDRVLDGPQDFELIVIDCDSIGGLAQGRRAHMLLKATGRCLPVILVSSECAEQTFPFNRYEATELRAPLSAVSLRVGFEHALQERLLMARAS